MHISIALFVFFLACALLYGAYRHSANRIFFLPALACKLLAGLAYGWLYVVYYAETGDSFNYFHDAGKLYAVGRQDTTAYWQIIFWNSYTPIWETTLSLWQEPRAFWFVKLVSLFMWIAGENYWLIACWFSLISFLGSWVLVEALGKCFPTKRLEAIAAFLFFPSVLFFSSGLTKESLSIAFLGFATALLLRFCYAPIPRIAYKIACLPAILVCAWGLWQLKFYYLALWSGSVATFAITFWLSQWLKPSYKGEIALFILVACTGFFCASWLFNFDELVLMIVLNHNTTYIHSHPTDLVHYSIYGGQGYISLNASWQSLLYNAPLAIEAGLFRPYIWEASDKLKLIMGLENLIVLVGAVWAVLILWRRQVYVPNTFTRLFICAGVLYVCGLLVIIALASPNMGALVRYKVVVSSWIVFGILLIIKKGAVSS